MSDVVQDSKPGGNITTWCLVISIGVLLFHESIDSYKKYICSQVAVVCILSNTKHLPLCATGCCWSKRLHIVNSGYAVKILSTKSRHNVLHSCSQSANHSIVFETPVFVERSFILHFKILTYFCQCHPCLLLLLREISHN